MKNISDIYQNKSGGESIKTKRFIQQFYQGFVGSVFNFVSLPFHLIPEAGCGRSPRTIINAGFPVNYSWQKSSKEKI